MWERVLGEVPYLGVGVVSVWVRGLCGCGCGCDFCMGMGMGMGMGVISIWVRGLWGCGFCVGARSVRAQVPYPGTSVVCGLRTGVTPSSSSRVRTVSTHVCVLSRLTCAYCLNPRVRTVSTHVCVLSQPTCQYRLNIARAVYPHLAAMLVLGYIVLVSRAGIPPGTSRKAQTCHRPDVFASWA